MEVLSVKNLNFQYEGEQEFQLKNISFTVSRGEFLLLCGGSGCGKTTLLKLLKKELVPAGSMEGTVWQHYESGRIGYLFQNPDSQIVCRTVEEELVFGGENLGMSREQMGRSVAEISAYLGIEGLLRQETATLSGGQKQILNLASILLMQPKILLLDEPTSQLDPVSTYDFWQLIRKLREDLNLTIILVEHNLDNGLKEAERVLFMEQGRLLYDGKPKGFVDKLLYEKNAFCASLPVTIWLFCESGRQSGQGDYPYTVRALLGAVGEEAFSFEKEEAGASAEKREPDLLSGKEMASSAGKGKNIIHIHSGYFKYTKHGEDVLKNLELSLEKGKIYGFIGGNGAGKSTLFSVLSGYRKLYRGKCSVAGKVGILPQNPVYAFFKDVLYEDYAMIADKEKIYDCLQKYEFCKGLEPFLKKNPLDLSGGQMQKAAIGKLLLVESDIFLMDEPVKGMDGREKQLFRELLMELKANQKTILFISHDLEFVEQTADECLMMFDGSIAAKESPEEMFQDNRFYTTVRGRIRGMVKDESDVAH